MQVYLHSTYLQSYQLHVFHLKIASITHNIICKDPKVFKFSFSHLLSLIFIFLIDEEAEFMSVILYHTLALKELHILIHLLIV